MEGIGKCKYIYLKHKKVGFEQLGVGGILSCSGKVAFNVIYIVV